MCQFAYSIINLIYEHIRLDRQQLIIIIFCTNMLQTLVLFICFTIFQAVCQWHC